MRSSVEGEERNMLLTWLLKLLLLGLAIGKTLNRELTEDLLSKKHRKNVRPVINPDDQLEVNIIGALYQLADLDQRNNLATISAYFDLWWFDPTMTWDPLQYNGTKQMYLPSSEVWVPELYLYHSVQGSTPITVTEWAVQVSYNGEVRIFFPFTARALCPINVKYFPFDRQQCNFTFGSWSYKLESVKFVVKSEDVFLDDFFDNQEWILLESGMKESVARYNTTFHQESYSTVVMELVLKREHFYYIFNLMIPTTMVTVVAIIGFHAPSSSAPRRETKFRLGIMTLLSMGVMLLMVVEEMPKFSLASIPGQRGSFSDVPILGIYYIFLIFCISICTCTTSIFVLLERHALENPEYDKIPFWLIWLDFDFSNICRCNRRSKRRNNTEMKISQNGDLEENDSKGKSMDKSVRFERENMLQQGFDDPFSTSAVDIFHSTTSEQNIRPPPLYQRKVWSRRTTPGSSSGYTSIFAPDPIENLSKPLDRMADTLSVISQRLLSLQSRLDPHPDQPLLGEKGNTPPRSPKASREDRNGTKSESSLTRRQSAASRGQPILTKTWYRIISRIEHTSLALYLIGIVTMIILVINHGWY